MSPDRLQTAILANIHTLHLLVEDVQTRVADAAEAMEKGQQNQAIGSMYDIEDNLTTALALYRATIALHRQGR